MATTPIANTEYPASRWWGRFHDLAGTPWEHLDVRNLKDDLEDAPGHGPVIDYLHTAFHDEPVNGREDVLEAAIRACGELWPNRWTPADFMTVVRGYAQDYKSWEDAVQDYCDDHWPGLKAAWLKDGLQVIADLVKRESEIWVTEPDTGRVYVFNRPA
jgi:hypothetical protein